MGGGVVGGGVVGGGVVGSSGFFSGSSGGITGSSGGRTSSTGGGGSESQTLPEPFSAISATAASVIRPAAATASTGASSEPATIFL